QTMEQKMTLLSDIDPMMDDVKVLARCISIWKSHAAGKPNQPWGLDVVLQDPEGNSIQASIKLENMNKFLAILDEGSCYRIGDFGVGENGGKFPLLNHRHKLNFYRNTTVTRVIPFDQNPRGFNFEPFQNFTTRRFGSTDTVDVIGTIVSISNLILFESLTKLQSTIVCFPLNFTSMKIYQRLWHSNRENDGEDEKNLAISLYSSMKKEVTIEEFFAEIANRDPVPERSPFHVTMDSTESKSKTTAQSSSMTSGESSSFAAWHNTSKPSKAIKQLWWCKKHEVIEAVGPKYKVIVRVIDQTGSASLLLFDDMISKMVGVPCYKLKEQYGANAENTFPEELTNNIDDDDDVLETPAPTVGTKHSKLQYQDSLPFNLEVTPPSAKGKECASSAKGNEDHQVDKAAVFVGSNGNGKRIVIDLDEYDDEAASANRAKKQFVAVKIEKP
ncbi:replication protein A 70 kDa DNA-binding subunit B, partial [Tanacetum coccineum]